MWFLPPQGSDGFPGAVGAAGEKGKKARNTIITAPPPLCQELKLYRLKMFCFCGITQGPAGQAGGAGQRGPNVSST